VSIEIGGGNPFTATGLLVRRRSGVNADAASSCIGLFPALGDFIGPA